MTRLIKAWEEQRDQESRGAQVPGVSACEGDRRGVSSLFLHRMSDRAKKKTRAVVGKNEWI